jgi:catechol 2,3-dioxygenase-like lactoylglutathione lyase family enzyme
MAPMIKTLAHVCLILSDLKKAEKFFCKGLGLKKKFDFVKGKKVIGLYLQVSKNSFIEIFHDAASAGAKAGPIRHICLETDDIDALIKSLKRKRIQVGEKKKGCDQSWQVWIKAPDGVDIEFHQYTPKSSQITGKRCLVDW